MSVLASEVYFERLGIVIVVGAVIDAPLGCGTSCHYFLRPSISTMNEISDLHVAALQVVVMKFHLRGSN